jgi:signal transduction histidine kinase
VVADMFVNFNVLPQTLGINNFIETFWFLGVGFRIYGLVIFKKTATYNTKPHTWICKLSSFETQSAIWIAAFCISALCIFLGFVYLLSANLSISVNAMQMIITTLLLSTIFIAAMSKLFTKLYSSPKAPKQEKQLFTLASQVAHDIRSPLAALKTTLKQAQGIEEGHRIIVRNATNRINDIANNLLTKYSNPTTDAPNNKRVCNMTSELLVSVLDAILSEKRAQYVDKNVKFEFDVGHDAYGMFAKINFKAFQRTLSNLINNAVEAVEGIGTVTICLDKHNDKVSIGIVDTGKGIPPELIDKITKGLSIGKTEGHGLGVSYAVQQIQLWNGSYKIESEVGSGTRFIIELPVATPPRWFQAHITVAPNDTVIILDDDTSIHDVLNMRFKDLSVSLIHCHSYKELVQHYQDTCNCIFLLDYELVGSDKTGIDIIRELNLAAKSILVTSCYEEAAVRNACNEMGVKIIPKNFAPYVPIKVMTKQPELIFLDDDSLMTMLWQDYADFHNKEILVFNTVGEFSQAITDYNKDIPIYIDSNLQQNIKGEDVAKELFDQGYTNLYLATGYTAEDFSDMYWIKSVVGKEPLF